MPGVSYLDSGHRAMARHLLFAAVVFAVLAMSGSAYAQTCAPGYSPPFQTGGSVFGYLASQWSALFGGKVDVQNGNACSLTTQQLNVSITNCNPSTGGSIATNASGFLYCAPLNSNSLTQSVQYLAPSSGDTVAVVSAQANVLALHLTPAAELSSLTVNVPLGSFDAQWIEIASTQTIDSLTIVGTGGALIAGSGAGPMMLTANGGISFRFRVLTSTWFRRY